MVAILTRASEEDRATNAHLAMHHKGSIAHNVLQATNQMQPDVSAGRARTAWQVQMAFVTSALPELRRTTSTRCAWSALLVESLLTGCHASDVSQQHIPQMVTPVSKPMMASVRTRMVQAKSHAQQTTLE